MVVIMSVDPQKRVPGASMKIMMRLEMVVLDDGEVDVEGR